MPRRNLKWGKLYKLSGSGYVCAEDRDGHDHPIREECLPADVRETPQLQQEGENRFINPKYQGLYVLIDTSSVHPHEIVNPPRPSEIPDEISGPFYLVESGEIVDDRNALASEESSWSPPEPDREDSVEWTGTEQEAGSQDADKRTEVFGEERDNKNDLIDGSM